MMTRIPPLADQKKLRKGLFFWSFKSALHYIDNHKASFELYGQEVNPETFAICTSDMLIKGEKSENIAYGSTLSNDGFPQLHFDFMLSNPPYGKAWKIEEDAIVDNRGKKGKEEIKDKRFQIGLPSISCFVCN